LEETDDLLDEIDEILDVEVVATETLKLSDLIRNGSKMNKQAFGAFKTGVGETCALQAAYENAQQLDLV